MWRKKVDSSLLRHNGTTIPQWVCKIWGIEASFSKCSSRKDEKSKVTIYFDEKKFDGWVTIAKHGRESCPAYRLWFPEELSYELKNAFIMSFVRDIEARLRVAKGTKDKEIEDEIPFWEFLDIEYDEGKRTFYFQAYFKQNATFTELFSTFVNESPILHKIDDELKEKPPFRIYKTGWKERKNLFSELGPTNVLYYLIDTKNKLLYIGEASTLVARLNQLHPTIPDWDYYRYDILPNEISDHRKTFERMLIRDLAALLENKVGLDFIRISDYKLANDKIDSR